MHDPHPPTWDDWQEKVRELREQAGMTQRALAHAARLSKSTVNALETGRSIPKRAHAVALDEGLSTLGVLADLWDDVYGRGRRIPEWWAKPLELEQRASRILEYDPCIIPGLLQTEDYAREMLRFGKQGSGDVERDVKMRVSRLPALHAQVSFILAERALLSHPPGRPDIVSGQLDHILELIQDGCIRLQVLPDEGIPLIAHNSFRVTIINSEQAVAYGEHNLGGLTKSDPKSVEAVLSLFERLASDSLPVKLSMEWIRRSRAQWISGESPATAVTKTTTVWRSPSLTEE